MNVLKNLFLLKGFPRAEENELITTSFREKTEAALQVGLKYATGNEASRAYRQTLKAVCCKGLCARHQKKQHKKQRKPRS